MGANNQPGKKTGVLLVNLGTPDQPSTGSVRRYLWEFLSDKRVVQIPRFIWWFILNFIILFVRPGKSAALYREIWTQDGSPLMAHSKALTQGVAAHFASKPDSGAAVALAMRYGKPAIADGLSDYKNGHVDEIVIVPLYPQYSSTSSGTAFEKVFDVVKQWTYIPALRVVSDYHDHPLYIKAIADSIRAFWESSDRSQLLLFSFHGLPEKSREQGDPYYDQCQKTARLIAGCLELDQHEWRIVFQSRFGYQEWLKPYCVDELGAMPGEGVDSVDVICPGFAVDCLETLEEIAMTNKQVFLDAGGKQYRYLPALNASQGHVDLMISLIDNSGRGSCAYTGSAKRKETRRVDNEAVN